MHYKHPTDHIEFEIPDAWLSAAGAVNIRPNSTAFAATTDPSWPTILVPITDITAPTRNAGVVGLHKDRSISLLQAYVQGIAVPPVEVHEPPGQNAHRYSVRDGYHRYYISIALGYTELPVSVRPYFDMSAL